MTRAMAKIWFWAACRPTYGSCSGPQTADPSPMCVGRAGKMIRMPAVGNRLQDSSAAGISRLGVMARPGLARRHDLS